MSLTKNDQGLGITIAGYVGDKTSGELYIRQQIDVQTEQTNGYYIVVLMVFLKASITIIFIMPSLKLQHLMWLVEY